MPPPVVPRGPAIPLEELDHFSAFPTRLERPPTPDRLEPDVFFEHRFVGVDLLMPDGETVKMWTFERTLPVPLPEGFPGPTLRVREGQLVHDRLRPRTRDHTIHHHGIEPTPFNDGVGHTSFEVQDEYTYQLQMSHAGLYFYHCHVNTVLHFEMGMYGLLVVDPPTGQGTVRRGTEIVPYDVEAAWVPDEIDPRWHLMDHHEGIHATFGVDAGLNRFEPKYFLVTGVPSTGDGASATRTDPRVAVAMRRGQTALFHVLNAGYTIQRFTLEGLAAEVINVDGHTLGSADDGRFSRPFPIAAGQSFELTTAQRWMLLAKPTVAGRYRLKVEFLHWITRRVLHVAETFVTVA